MKRKTFCIINISNSSYIYGKPECLYRNRKKVTLLEILGIVAPLNEAVPVATAIDTVQYTGTISWSPADNPFAAATEYPA